MGDLDQKNRKRIGSYEVCPGFFELKGATVLGNGINFTIQSRYGSVCELLLFSAGSEEIEAVLPFPEDCRMGDVFSMYVFDLDSNSLEYAYRIDGPEDQNEGLLFQPQQILLDPYARAVTGQNPYHGRVVQDVFDWGTEKRTPLKISDLVIYELHVRGFTRDPSSGVQHPGTFAGLQEKISYLKALGINAVELLPVFSFDETRQRREIDGQELLDYWGYNTVGFFAPKASYAAREDQSQAGTELKQLIKALHENGMEVILDVVFNHTAEGNEDGGTFCFKGLDNQIYYLLTPDGTYYNFTGCGNTFNCNHPMVQQLILDCLRYWTIYYHVDGFRFDLASILTRDEDGTPLDRPPLLRQLSQDPILSQVKLIAEAWDAGGLYQVGTFPGEGRWAEWNGRYRDSVRSFLKGDFHSACDAAKSIAGSADLYGDQDRDTSINFLTCHDGFTLYDLYAYNEKHNEANGWDNTDGTDDNRSWNCGVEGETTDPQVASLRARMIRNACAVLLCSRGTPMFTAGDEFGRTQKGNNNAYCQDNEISWIDWTLLEKNRQLFSFFQFMIAYRKKHRVLREELPPAICGMASTCVYNEDAETTDLSSDAQTFSISFAGFDEDRQEDDLVDLSLNAYWEEAKIILPTTEGISWYLSVCTFGDEKGTFCYPEGQEIYVEHDFILPPRSVAVFTGRSCETSTLSEQDIKE